MMSFENQIQKLNESEERFMLDFVKLYHTANPNNTAANLHLAVILGRDSIIFEICDKRKLIYSHNG